MGVLYHEGLIIKKTEFTYFYLDQGCVVGNRATFSAEETRHLIKVCRVQAGDAISATDGNGCVYTIEIDDVSKTAVAGRITDMVTLDREATQCDLAVPAASAQKTDWVIEKCTELGVSAFHLFACDRSTGRRIRENRIERCRRIAVSAIKQSMRAFLPQFFSYEDLKSLAELFSRYDLVLYGHLAEGSQELRKALDSHTFKTALVLVGPEAGFTDGETRLLEDASAVPVSYGEHRLRMETAAIILAAFVLESQQPSRSGVLPVLRHEGCS